MPELPEVEITVRGLRRAVPGRTVKQVFGRSPNQFRVADSPLLGSRAFAAFRRLVRGKRIERVSRRGKYIAFYLRGGGAFTAHLKMTGHFLLGRWRVEPEGILPQDGGALSEKVNGYIRALFVFDKGPMLALSDVRRFGRFTFGRAAEIGRWGHGNVGLDMLDPRLTSREFAARVGASGRPVKLALLDQSRAAGLGNIYSDEALWRAKINPLAPAESLSEAEFGRIFRAAHSVLRLGIRLGGSSMENFRRLDGTPGGYMRVRQVYRREGEPCPRCGAAIRRMRLGGRSSCFCPACQPLPSPRRLAFRVKTRKI